MRGHAQCRLVIVIGGLTPVNAQIRNAILISFASAMPTVVLAQAAAPTESGQLEEIVITAQKRVERLQDVPVAAAVVSQDALAKSNASDISDLNNLVPSLDLNATINGRVPIGVRGISSNANEATVGFPSGVAIMIDGVPVPSDSYDGNQLDDVEKVEVLKGPQATLGGRTAAAGVINMVTRGPSDQFQGSIGATATSDSEYRGNVFFSGPMSNNVDFSVSAYANTRDYPITNIAINKQTNQQTSGVRGKLLIKVNDDFDISLMAHAAQAKSQGGNFVYTYLTPGASLLVGTANPNPFPPPVQSTISQATLLAGITPSYTNLAYNSPVTNAGSNTQDTDASINLEYRFSGLTLTSTTAYQHETQTNSQDLFALATFFSNDISASFTNFFLNILHLPGVPPGTPAGWAPFNNTQTQIQDVKQVSEELKLASPADQDLSYLVGFFYSDTKVGLDEDRTFTPAAVDYFVQPETKTYDLYGRVTWKFTPALSLVAGLRYNADRLSYFENELLYATSPGVAYGPLTSASSDNSSAVVGDISLKYELAQNSMVYATYSRGYAPRAYNTALALANSTPQSPVGQEHVDNFEIGTKGFYFDHRLSFDVAIFDTIYKDYQIQSYSALPGYVNPPLVLSNAAEAQTRGVEADLAYAATLLTTLTTDLAYVDAKFKNYANAPCWGGTGQQTTGCTQEANGQFVQNVSGDPMPNAPKFKGTLGIDQRIPLNPSPVDLVVGATYAYRSSAEMLPDQNPQAIQHAFGLLNLSASLKDKNGRYSVTAFLNNVTNHAYYGDVEDFWTGPWAANAVVAQPARDAQRYGGVRFRVDF
jgi:iron complex outermembrane receptor protein